MRRAPDDTGHRHGALTLSELVRRAPTADVATIAVVPDGQVVVRLVRALEWVLAEGFDIVCIALGIGHKNVVLGPLLEELRRSGTLVVAAVGNGGPGRVTQPAVDPNVLSTGACGSGGRVQPFSGSCVDATGGAHQPDLLAPSSTGTSLACATVAGVAGELLARCRPVGRQALEVASALAATTRPVHEEDVRRTAAGEIDIEAAARMLGSPLPLPVASTSAAPGRVGAEPFIDRRLQWFLSFGDPAGVVRSVVVLDGVTRVVDRRRDAYDELLADPRLIAASAADVRAWTLS